MLKFLISKSAEKSLRKAPLHIQTKMDRWVLDVITQGLEDNRLIPGWHDEPLTGQRQGQRSIRLNRHWLAIYEETELGITITILEVTSHDYRIK